VSKMAETRIRVQQIHCSSCENTIRKALGRLEGVRQVTPDQRTNEIRVVFDEKRVSEDQIRTRLDEIGYTPVTA